MAETDYSTSAVYRENDTGKIRVKGATKIDHVSDSPSPSVDDVAAAVDAILDLLTAAGINPES